MNFRVERDGDHGFRLFGELDMASASELLSQLERDAQQMAISAWIYRS